MGQKPCQTLDKIGLIQILSASIERAGANFDLRYTATNEKALRKYIKEVRNVLIDMEKEIESSPRPYQKLGRIGLRKKYNHETGKFEYQ